MDCSGAKTIKILNVLDALDRHSFERIDQNNSLDTLYNKIFLPPNSKDNSNPLLGNMSMSTENETLKDNRSEYVNIVFYIYFIYYTYCTNIILLIRMLNKIKLL